MTGANMSDSNDDDSLDSEELVKFFPELAVVCLIILFAPVWAVKLLHRGYILAGILFWIGTWGLGYYAYRSYKKGDQGGLFFAMLAVLVLDLGIAKWTNQF